MYEYFGLLAIFACAGWIDYKTHTLPDLFAALLWVSTLFPPFSIAITGMSFAIVFLLSSIYEFVKNKTFWGLGDTYAFPPYITAIYATNQAGIIAGLATLIALTLLAPGKKKVGKIETTPLVAYLALSYATALIAYNLFM